MTLISDLSDEPCDLCHLDAQFEVQAEWYAGKRWADNRPRAHVYILCASHLRKLGENAKREAAQAGEFADAVGTLLAALDVKET